MERVAWTPLALPPLESTYSICGRHGTFLEDGTRRLSRVEHTRPPRPRLSDGLTFSLFLLRVHRRPTDALSIIYLASIIRGTPRALRRQLHGSVVGAQTRHIESRTRLTRSRNTADRSAQPNDDGNQRSAAIPRKAQVNGFNGLALARLHCTLVRATYTHQRARKDSTVP